MNPPARNTQKGQVLILVLLLVPTLMVFLAFLVNSGIAVRNRIKTQNSCDAVTLSAGYTYARSMNMIAASNKAWGIFAMVDLASILLDGIDPMSRNIVASAQDGLLMTAPGMVVSEAVWIAGQNQFRHFQPLSPIVVLNGDLVPKFPVRRRTLADFLSNSSEPFEKTPVYSYQPKDGGPRVFVTEDECYRDARGRWHLRDKGKGGMSNIYVKREKGTKGKEFQDKMDADPGFLGLFKFDLMETSANHRVAVFGGTPGGRRAMNDPLLGGSGQTPINYALAETGIGEGSINFFSWKFYRASLIPVQLEDFAGGIAIPFSSSAMRGKTRND